MGEAQLGDVRLSRRLVRLGVLNAWMWAREKKPPDGVRAGLLESTRWVEGYERLAEFARELPATRFVVAGGDGVCAAGVHRL
jgi:hypothetical protein